MRNRSIPLDPARVPAPVRSARLGGRAMAVAIALVGLALVAATDQIVPASSPHQAQLRVWLASRAAGLVGLVLLAFQIVVGLVLSHPLNKSTWRLSRQLLPWHETAWLFVLAFLGLHIVGLVVDPYAGLGLSGALIPGLSSYRTAPVAIGTLALYALLVTGLTARFTRLLPAGGWLKIHRLAAVVFVLAWMHGFLAGTDSQPLTSLYVLLAGAVGMAAAYRFWVSRQGRPSFATVPEGAIR